MVLHMAYNPSLTSFTGLEQLTRVGGLSVYDNPSLASFEGLGGLTSIEGYLDVAYNPALTSFAGFGGLTSVGAVMIYSNSSLTSRSGFDSLTMVGESLMIVENPSVTSLGFPALESVGWDFVIENNFALPTEAAVELSERITIGGTVSIHGNGCALDDFHVEEGGYVTSGPWHGFAWTFALGEGSTIAPSSFESLPAGGQLCASGVVAPEPNYECVAIIGININEDAEGANPGIVPGGDGLPSPSR
jgi:hypothetical protein